MGVAVGLRLAITLEGALVLDDGDVLVGLLVVIVGFFDIVGK